MAKRLVSDISSVLKSQEFFKQIDTPMGLTEGSFRPLIIGDLHFSDRPSPTHIDYLRDSTEYVEEVTRMIIENQATHVILTGDLIGRNTERNIQNREVLTYFMAVLKTWNTLTNENVYCVKGNHDFATNHADFDMFVTLGFIKLVDYLDIGSVRFHLVNYGEHTRKLDIHPEYYNVAITHTELHVAGITSWFFRSKEAVDIETLDNFYGIDLILGGHIHTPSPKMVSTFIKDKEVHMMYLGTPIFTSYERTIWEHSYAALFTTDSESVDLKTLQFKIKDSSEIFTPRVDRTEAEVDEDEGVSLIDIESLSEILAEFNAYNFMGEIDFVSQIKQLGGIDKDAVDLAIKYLEEEESKLTG